MLKSSIKILIIIVMVYAVGRFVVVYQDSRLTGERAPYVQMLTTNSVIVHWLTEEEHLGVIRYGEDPLHLAKIELDEDTASEHIVTLSNLKPATRYYYQVGDTSGFGVFDPQINWFKTYPENVVATRIWVLGDSGEAGETLNQVRDEALSWMKKNALPSTSDAIADSEEGADSEKSATLEEKEGKLTTRNASDSSAPEPLINIWLALGDIAYRSGTNAQYQSALFDPFEAVLANTVISPVYGNHDDRRWAYFRIFDLPENGETGGLASETENYYAIDYSNIHFIILDSQDSSRSPTGDMAVWLKQDLAQNTRPWVVVAFHHPPYSKGSHDSDDDSDSGGRMQEMRENILPILEQAGVDLVLSGHSHMYERSYLIDCAYEQSKKFSSNNIVSPGINNKHQHYLKPLNEKQHQGTVYVVAGSSSKVDKGPLDHPVHHTGLLEAGSMVIDVVDNKLTSRFINNKGEVRDEFSIEKKAEYVSDYSGCQ